MYGNVCSQVDKIDIFMFWHAFISLYNTLFATSEPGLQGWRVFYSMVYTLQSPLSQILY